MTPQTEKLLAACERWWGPYRSDCSGFAKAVAHTLGIALTGVANDLIDEISQPPWRLIATAAEAAQLAESGLVSPASKPTPTATS